MDFETYTDLTARRNVANRLTARAEMLQGTSRWAEAHHDALRAEVALIEATIAADPSYVPPPSFQRKLARI